jgi:hypothetical protein
MLFAGAFTQSSDEAFAQEPSETTINVGTDVDTSQSQSVSVTSGGDSDSSSKSSSDSKSIINSTEISNYKTRTPPITTFPPYLPYWNHGGWGTIKAYFPNGPNSDDQVYERIFDPRNSNDMRGLKSVLESLPYDKPLNIFGGILNGLGTVFGGPDNYHHGRGFEIASSLVRKRRTNGKALLVFIDSNVDTKLLKEAGYVYVGKVSLEGNVDRNWDHVYDAAVAETLPWDVDILLISGGMKGVTVGSNTSFPGAGGAYSQANYSISMFGGVSSGITEGKGKAIISAAGYRYSPVAAHRRRIPQAFYDKFRVKIRPVQQVVEVVKQIPPSVEVETEVDVDVPQEEPSVVIQQQQSVINDEPLSETLEDVPPALKKEECTPVKKEKRMACPKRKRPGVKVSRELLEMAGFPEHQHIHNLSIK